MHMGFATWVKIVTEFRSIVLDFLHLGKSSGMAVIVL